MAGGFDFSDCIAEHLTIKTENGAFAVIMNARYGWFWSFSTDGDSSRFTREFWDAVFGENIPEISKANQDSKEDNLYLIQRSCIRWVYYQLNLFGDPTLPFFNSENTNPLKPEKPSGEIEGKIGEEYSYTSSSTDNDDDQLYYKWDFGDGTLSEWLGPYDSGEEVSVSHNWSEEGTYQIKVMAKDEHNAKSEWSDPLSISMPKNKEIFKSIMIEIIEKILERFPILEQILSSGLLIFRSLSL